MEQTRVILRCLRDLHPICTANKYQANRLSITESSSERVEPLLIPRFLWWRKWRADCPIVSFEILGGKTRDGAGTGPDRPCFDVRERDGFKGFVPDKLRDFECCRVGGLFIWCCAAPTLTWLRIARLIPRGLLSLSTVTDLADLTREDAGDRETRMYAGRCWRCVCAPECCIVIIS